MRKRKTLEETTKHLTNEEKLKRELGEKAIQFEKDQLKNPPKWLINDLAVKEWHRLVNEFEKNGNSLICNLDYNNLGAYCNSFASYTELVTRIGTNFGVGKEVHPLSKSLLNYSDEMRKYAAMLGLSIDSRLKKAPEALENKEKEIENSFGDI